MKLKIFFPGILLLTVIVFSGCSRQDHKELPMARAELVERFFQSMKNGANQAAADQGIKLRTMEPANQYLSRMIDTLQINIYFARIQKLLNAGNVKAALKEAEAGCMAFPLNRPLLQCRAKLRRLTRVEEQLSAMEEADNALEMKAAYRIAFNNLSGMNTPKMRAYFAAYQTRILKQSEKEAKQIRNQAELEKKLEREALQNAAKLPPAAGKNKK